MITKNLWNTVSSFFSTIHELDQNLKTSLGTRRIGTEDLTSDNNSNLSFSEMDVHK